MPRKKLLSVAILAAPETTAGTVFGLFDLFSSAGRDWDLLTTGTVGPGRAQPFIVAAQRDQFEAANGAWIQPHGTFDDYPIPDIVYVPEILVPPGAPLSGLFDHALEWLRRCDDADATLASACSGALLLAEAGLLDGCDATTHWAYCDEMRRHYPTITIHDAR